MVTHRIDQTAVIAALRGAAPYIRLYKGKIFVIKAGGAVFGDAAGTRSLIEQIAILHHLGIRVVLVHGGGPAARRDAALARHRAAHGARPAHHRRQVDRRDDDGAERADQHADPRDLPRGRHRRRRPLGRRRGTGPRHPPPAGQGGRRVRGLRLRRRHRLDRHDGPAQAARRGPDAGREPAVVR